MGIAASDIWTIIHYDLPCMIVVPNNSSWGRNALMGEHIHPNLDWSVGKNNRWDLALEAHGAHGEHVERSEDLGPAPRRAFASGKPAVVNVAANSDGSATATHGCI